jgi:hypothetical protein
LLRANAWNPEFSPILGCWDKVGGCVSVFFLFVEKLLLWLVWRLLSALRAGVLSFASPKESSQRKGDPRVGARYAGSLRYSA